LSTEATTLLRWTRAKQGAHPVAIKERLGHESITVTMDTYGGMFPGLDDAIREGLDAAFGESLAASPRPERSEVVNLRMTREAG
jgi:hypothetical protein